MWKQDSRGLGAVFSKCGNRTGTPHAVLHLMFVEAVLPINLGCLICSSSESECFYRLIYLQIPTAGNEMSLLVIYYPMQKGTLLPSGAGGRGVGERQVLTQI